MLPYLCRFTTAFCFAITLTGCVTEATCKSNADCNSGSICEAREGGAVCTPTEAPPSTGEPIAEGEGEGEGEGENVGEGEGEGEGEQEVGFHLHGAGIRPGAQAMNGGSYKLNGRILSSEVGAPLTGGTYRLSSSR